MLARAPVQSQRQEVLFFHIPAAQPPTIMQSYHATSAEPLWQSLNSAGTSLGSGQDRHLCGCTRQSQLWCHVFESAEVSLLEEAKHCSRQAAAVGAFQPSAETATASPQHLTTDSGASASGRTELPSCAPQLTAAPPARSFLLPSAASYRAHALVPEPLWASAGAPWLCARLQDPVWSGSVAAAPLAEPSPGSCRMRHTASTQKPCQL